MCKLWCRDLSVECYATHLRNTLNLLQAWRHNGRSLMDVLLLLPPNLCRFRSSGAVRTMLANEARAWKSCCATLLRIGRQKDSISWFVDSERIVLFIRSGRYLGDTRDDVELEYNGAQYLSSMWRWVSKMVFPDEWDLGGYQNWY